MGSDGSSEGGLVYPRLTTEYLKSLIVSTTFSHVPEARTTICTVMLKFDYAISEDVVCPSHELYDKAVGEKHALNKVLATIREREYYVLRRRLHEDKQSNTGESDGR